MLPPQTPCRMCQSKSGRTPSPNILFMFFKHGAKLCICKIRQNSQVFRSLPTISFIQNHLSGDVWGPFATVFEFCLLFPRDVAHLSPTHGDLALMRGSALEGRRAFDSIHDVGLCRGWMERGNRRSGEGVAAGSHQQQ